MTSDEHDDRLQHRRDEHDGGGADAIAPPVTSDAPSGTSTMTASSEPKSTYGSTCTCWKRSVSVWPTLVTSPIGIPFG